MLLPLVSAFLAAGITPIPASAVSSPRSPLVTWETNSYTVAKAKSTATLIEDLEEFAAWCSKGRAYLERDRAYELLIEFDPDNKKARKGLGYIRDRKAEEWIRKRKYRQPTNASAQAAMDSLEMRAAILRRHISRMIDAVEAYDDKLAPATKRRDLSALLKHKPDHEALRRALGQVRLPVEGAPDRWVSASSADTLRRRAKLANWRASTRAAVPEPKPTKLQADEQKLAESIAWTSTLESGSLRLLGSGSEQEARDLLTDMQVIRAYFPQVLGGESGPVKDATLYLLSAPGASTAFRNQSSQVSRSNRDDWNGMAGTFLGNTPNCAIFGPSAEIRRDMALRLATSLYLVRNYGIRANERGWIVEGFGLYLVHQITGTRLSFTRGTDPKAGPSSQGNAQRKFDERIKNPDADWLATAQAAIQSGDVPNLAFVLGKSSDAMTSRDSMVANTLAAYLVEARGLDITAEVLSRIGGKWAQGQLVEPGEASARVIEDVFGVPLKGIYPIIVTWLQETNSN